MCLQVVSGPRPPDQEVDSHSEEPKEAHLIPQGPGLIPGVGPRGRQQAVSGEDGSRAQDEGCEQVDVDVITSAAEPPVEFES